MNVIYYDLRRIEEILNKKAEELISYDRFIGIGRAGAIIGGLMACKLGKKFSYMDSNAEGVYPQPKRNERCLLIDDIIATGKTMKQAMRKTGITEAFVLALDFERCDDEDLLENVIVAEYTDNKRWLLFPWDLLDFALGKRKAYSRDWI